MAFAPAAEAAADAVLKQGDQKEKAASQCCARHELLPQQPAMGASKID